MLSSLFRSSIIITALLGSSFQSTVLVVLTGCNDLFDKPYLSRMRMAQLQDHRMGQMSRRCNQPEFVKSVSAGPGSSRAEHCAPVAHVHVRREDLSPVEYSGVR